MTDLEQLLDHMAKHYSDWHIANDLDCVLSLASSDEDAEAIRAYARARRTAPEFRPKDSKANNHAQIASTTLTNPTQVATTVGAKACGWCEDEFVPRRSDAIYCSSRCRVRSHRASV